MASALLSNLAAKGWSLQPEEVLQQVAEAEEFASVQELLQNICDVDLERVGVPCLPEDVNRMVSGTIMGPLVLQVQAMRDIARSSTSLVSGTPRMLMLMLSDGKLTCKAAEHKHVECLSDMMLPGTKVAVSHAQVRGGVLLLEPRSIKNLGGRVELLAAGNEFQRKFAGVERAQHAQHGGAEPSGGSAAGTRPPPFRHFVPGRDSIKRTPQTPLPAATTAAAGCLGDAPAPPFTVTQAALREEGKGAAAASRRALPVDVVPAPALRELAGGASLRATSKLAEELHATCREAGAGHGGGRGRGRGGRRRYVAEDDDAAHEGLRSMKDYEAQRRARLAAALAGGAAGNGGAPWLPDEERERLRQEEADAALARALQAQLDMEVQAAQVQEAAHGRRAQREQQQHGATRCQDGREGRSCGPISDERGGGGGGQEQGGPVGDGGARMPAPVEQQRQVGAGHQAARPLYARAAAAALAGSIRGLPPAPTPATFAPAPAAPAPAVAAPARPAGPHTSGRFPPPPVPRPASAPLAAAMTQVLHTAQEPGQGSAARQAVSLALGAAASPRPHTPRGTDPALAGPAAPAPEPARLSTAEPPPAFRQQRGQGPGQGKAEEGTRVAAAGAARGAQATGPGAAQPAAGAPQRPCLRSGPAAGDGATAMVAAGNVSPCAAACLAAVVPWPVPEQLQLGAARVAQRAVSAALGVLRAPRPTHPTLQHQQQPE